VVLELQIELKGVILDKRSVERSIATGRERALKRAGAYVRRSARASLLDVEGKSSQPGQPPFSHTGILKRIFYAYDTASKTVVIGPVAARTRAAAALEYGGFSKFKVPGGRRRRRYLNRRILARPFMRPALERQIKLGRIAQAFSKSMRGV